MQNGRKQDLIKLKQLENEFGNLVDSSTREDLAKCAKFLAMYIALYRQKFGEIPRSGYEKLMSSSEIDNELLSLLDEGMNEAAEMLKLVLMQKNSNDESHMTQSYMN